MKKDIFTYKPICIKIRNQGKNLTLHNQKQGCKENMLKHSLVFIITMYCAQTQKYMRYQREEQNLKKEILQLENRKGPRK